MSPKNQLGCDKEWDSNVAREIVAGTLAVELAEAVADVSAGSVVGTEVLGLDAVGPGVASVNAGHDGGSSSSKEL